MCVIIISTEKNKRPTLAQLEGGEDSNKHGAGMSWLDNGKVKFIKGLDLTAKNIWERIQDIDGPILIHFRTASSGPKIDELCHPFPISASRDQLDALEGDVDAVFMHNGTIKDDVWMDMLFRTDLNKMIGGHWSDTRAIAYIMGHYSNTQLLSIFDHQKFAVMTPKGITYWGTWQENDGLLTSCFLRAKWNTDAWKSKDKDDFWTKKKQDEEKETESGEKRLLPAILDYDSWNSKQWKAWHRGDKDEEILALADDESDYSSCYAQ